jgi:7-cyano-7-deazaguanine synthase
MNDNVAILLSGGMDSSALCAWIRPQAAIFIDYGQVCAEAEAEAAEQIARELSVKFHTLALDCEKLGSGDLAGTPPAAMAPASDWWPFRNQLLVTAAAMRSVMLGLDHLMLGTVETDSNHADGSIAFIQALSALLQLQEGNLRLSAPAIEMNTVELIQRSGIDLGILCWTHSCHRSNLACGDCRGCNKHREVMAGLGYEPY